MSGFGSQRQPDRFSPVTRPSIPVTAGSARRSRVRDADQIFTAADATVRLGVGKNMVRAIRFWATAAKVIEPFPNPEHPRVPRYVESNLSRATL